jgi:hypothetical protein
VLALLILLCMLGYIGHKKGLFWLRSLMQKAHDHVQALEDEKELLAKQQADLDQAIKDQTLLFEHLNKSVVQWQLTQEKKIADEHARYQALLIVALENNKKRQLKIQEMYLAKQVIPQACIQARRLFKEQFSSQEQANHFLSAIVDRIEQAP